ncbi:TIGR00645 family protein [Brevundimonas aveniformis]|uniref:TIGR00645 family protein n=1 Tax=Brevundimonas aveniformis TaxID=370977 RepID=UPI0004012862|nr:TIGR00645 family protein [Brevundimonas aveniformis]
MSSKPPLETAFERALFRSRWLMAPFYLGLVIALALLLVIFVKELIYYVPQILAFDGASMSANDGILAVLTLVDLSLAGNLLLIVMFSGYENFVSKLDIDESETDRPPWMGTVDFSGLKMKLIASIVAISGIQLLKTFMNIGRAGYELNPDEAFWGVVIHLTFVVSGVLLALMDWLSAKTDKH